jgi:hypothetical protein
MDTTGKLSKVEGDETAIRLEFIKARHRTPANAGQFAPLIFRPSDDWNFEIAKAAKGSKSGGEVADIVDEFPSVYEFLADGAHSTRWLTTPSLRERNSRERGDVCGERIEFLLEALVGRFSGVDRAADGEPGSRGISPGHGRLK